MAMGREAAGRVLAASSGTDSRSVTWSSAARWRAPGVTPNGRAGRHPDHTGSDGVSRTGCVPVAPALRGRLSMNCGRWPAGRWHGRRPRCRWRSWSRRGAVRRHLGLQVVGVASGQTRAGHRLGATFVASGEGGDWSRTLMPSSTPSDHRYSRKSPPGCRSSRAQYRRWPPVTRRRSGPVRRDPHADRRRPCPPHISAVHHLSAAVTTVEDGHTAGKVVMSPEVQCIPPMSMSPSSPLRLPDLE